MNVEREMPKYKCHKEVWALQIRKVEIKKDERGRVSIVDGGYLHPVEGDYASIEVTGPWLDKHNPQPGGYYVIYNGGYISYSPQKPFEEGYTRI
jgi:hypothetical protein